MSAARRCLLVGGEDHGAHVVDAVFGKEHVLCAAEADAFGAEEQRLLGVAGDVGVGADLQPAQGVCPAHEGDQVGVVGLHGEGLQFAGDDAAGGSVEGDPVAVAIGVSLDAQLLVRLVDDAVSRAGHAALAHAAGDDGGVRCHAAARGENAGCDLHAGDVLRRGFAADEDDVLECSGGARLYSFLGGEDDLTDGRAGRCRQAGGEDFDLLALLHQAGNQEVVDLVWLDAHDGLFLGDEALLDHVDGDAHGGQAGALAIAGLQHVERAVLDGELEVLHVAVVLFHALGAGVQLFVDLGHGALQLADGHGSADAGDDVLALRVHQILAEEGVLAGGGVAGEADAGARGVAHVAEDHALHVDGGAQPVVDAVDAAIGLGAFAVPTAEDGVAGGRQLLQRGLREVLAALLLDELLVLDDDLFEGLGAEQVIQLDALFRLGAVEDVLKLLLADVEDDGAEHLDEAAIGVVGETGIAAAAGQTFDRTVVEAEVEDGVHHAGHGELGAGADGDQQGIIGRAQLLSLQLLQTLERVQHLDVDLGVQFSAHVLATGLGLDGESRRDRQAGVGHLGQASAFAAQHILHAAIALGLASAEEVRVLG